MKYLIVAIFSAFLFSSCDMISGNGNVVEENRQVSDFQSILSSGSIDVEVTPGNGISVTVVNDENLIPYVITEVKDGELQIHYKKNTNVSNDHAKVIITAPDIRKIRTSGSGDIVTNGTLTSSQTIEFVSSGSGGVTAAVDAPAITLTGSGSGDFKLSGQTKDLSCKLSGSGDADTRELKAENAVLKSAGSSDFKVFASVSLKASISGSGNILYWGNPALSDVRVSGSGKLKAGE